MTIFIKNTENLELCPLFSEDGTCLVEDINEAYMHLNAIERLIDEHLDQECIGEESLMAFITQGQLVKLRENAIFLKNYFQIDELAGQRFEKLFEIIEKLQD
jgi:hypothetical protein